LAGGPRTSPRVSDDVAEQGASRLGTLAILTAVSVIETAIVKNLIQPELPLAHAKPLFRLDALILVLASIDLAALQRSALAQPCDSCAAIPPGSLPLESGNLGIVALKNSPPNGLGRTAWDRICIVVLRRKK